MAISAGVLVEIVLVVFFRPIEVFQGQEFHFERHGVLACFGIEHLFNNSTVGWVGVIHACPVLRTTVVALLVVACGVDRGKVQLYKEAQRHHRRVVLDVHSLSKAGAVGAHFLVGFFVCPLA